MTDEDRQGLVKFGLRFAVGAAVAMIVTNACVAVAANGKCQYQDAQAIQTSYTVVEPTPPGYLICFTGIRTVGTLNGTFTSCNTDAMIAFPGPDQIYGGFADDTLVTRDGTLVLREYNIVDYDRLIVTSLVTTDPQKSTGAFAGMTGTMIGSHELLHFDNPRGVFPNIRITGYLCPAAQ